MPFRRTFRSFIALFFPLISVIAATTANAGELKATEINFFDGLETEPGKVVVQFHNALTSGNAEMAASLLADDVMVLEGGHAQRSAAEYTSHHLHADIAFLKEVESVVFEHHVWVNGDTALSSARTKTTGVYKGRPIDNQGIETIALKKINGQWRITYIHWS